MAENHNEVNPTITINVPGQTLPADGTTMGLLVSWLQQLDGSLTQIKKTVEEQSSLSITDDIRVLNEETLKKFRKSIADVKKTIAQQIAEGNAETKAELEALGVTVARLEEKMDDQTSLLKDILERQKAMQKALEDLNRARGNDSPVGGPVGGNEEPTDNPTGGDDNPTENPTGGDDNPTDNPTGGDGTPTEEPTGGDDTPTENPTGGDEEPTDNPTGGGDEPTDDPTDEPTDDPNKDPKKYKKAKFLTRSYKETTILAEPKRPWYKRLGKFAINHPVLTGLIGAGIGLGLVGAACGITAAAGLTGMLSYANFFLPSLVIGAGAGAIAGGTLSGVSRLFPFGRRERLYNKFAKKYERAMTIDRTKEVFASLEQSHKEKKQEARQKHRKANRLLKSLGVYKAAKSYHKLMAKASRKMKRYYAKKYVKEAESALVTKVKLNIAEEKKGKTMAVAGYLQKKRKLEDKFASGKIDEEEFEEEMQDLDDDVADLEGGEPGLSDVTGQMTYDKEALTLVEKVKAKQRTEGMNELVDNIKRRNSREVIGVEERVYEDPEEVQKRIEKLEAEGKTEEAERLKAQLEALKRERKEYEDWATENGFEVEEPVDVSESEFVD